MGLLRRITDKSGIIEGPLRLGRSTKQLLRTLEPKQIVLISHEDLDDLGAEGLIQSKVKAVINAAPTMTGKYPLSGPLKLLNAGIPILEIDADYFDSFKDGQEITIYSTCITGEHFTVPCRPFTVKDWQDRSLLAESNVNEQLHFFIDNTLRYAMKEKRFVTESLSLPLIKTPIHYKHVVVVVRGKGYKQDLAAIQNYIADYKPVLIGVDGGADALIEYGYTPHLIVGDMDSISDEALKSGAELLVHAYPSGKAPGLERIQRLELPADIIPAPGTSEDIAMLLAYEKGAEMIVTIGTHTHMIDFLEKGRKGMASTLLVRMKIGAKLIDAKGVSMLYHRPVRSLIPTSCTRHDSSRISLYAGYDMDVLEGRIRRLTLGGGLKHAFR
jgi:uncharacterized membrane-anchored protein